MQYTFAATATLPSVLCVCMWSFVFIVLLSTYYTPKMSSDYAIKLRATPTCLYLDTRSWYNSRKETENTIQRVFLHPNTHTRTHSFSRLLSLSACCCCCYLCIGVSHCVCEVNLIIYNSLCSLLRLFFVSLSLVRVVVVTVTGGFNLTLYFSYKRTGCC